jgi:N utilization substance protein B
VSDSSYTGGIGSRREARERILTLLYESEAKSCAIDEVLDALPVPPDAYVDEVARGVGDQQADIDERLAAHARGWTLERMPATDRAILRMAVYELGWCPDVPTAVVISEAVELAKQYSTDESGKFVNGMLSAIAADVRP